MKNELTDKEKFKIYIDGWTNAAPMLEEDRKKRIREMDTQQFISGFTGILPQYFARNGFRESSGFVEMQRLFSLLRDD